MKLVAFRVATPIGYANRLGALLDGHQDGRVVDLSTAYGEYLTHETDEPTPLGLANLRTPTDVIGWLQEGKKSREAAEQALAHARLPAPIPRPPSLRDYSIYQRHMTNTGRREPHDARQ